MAWTSAVLSAVEYSRAAAGKPLIGSNALMDTHTADRWTQVYAGDFTDTDRTDTDYPITRAWDGLPGYRTKPDVVSSSGWSLLIDRSGSPIEFDFLAFMNTNLWASSVSNIRLTIADDSAFTVRVENLWTGDLTSRITSERRFAETALFHTGAAALRYSAVAYIRISLSSGAAGAFVPEIGQIILGRRRQQKYQPDLAWDPTNQVSSMDKTTTRSGVKYKTARFVGRRDIAAVFKHDATDLQTDWLAWWTNIEGSEQPFIYFDDGYNQENDFWLMELDDDEFHYPYIDFQTREFNLIAQEQGPTFFSLE